MTDNDILEMDETLDFIEEEAELGMIDEDVGELSGYVSRSRAGRG